MKNLKKAVAKANKAKGIYSTAMRTLYSELEPFVRFEFFLNDFPDDGIMIMSEGESNFAVGMPITRAITAIIKDGELNEDNFEPIG